MYLTTGAHIFWSSTHEVFLRTDHTIDHQARVNRFFKNCITYRSYFLTIRAGGHFLLQGIFPAQGSNLGLQHCRQILYHLGSLGSLGLVEGQSPNMGEGCLLFCYNQSLPHLEGTMLLWLYYCCYICWRIIGSLTVPWLNHTVYRSWVSVQFSRSVVSDSLRPHEPQHARTPCPSPTPGVYLNPYPMNRWWHPTISSSVIPFSCPQSLPAPGSFQMSQLFTSGGQSIRVSASTSILPINSQESFPLGWTDWISLQSKGLSRVFSNTTVQTHQIFSTQLSSQANSHIHTWPLEKL